MLFTLSAIKGAAARSDAPFWFSAESMASFDSNVHPEVWTVSDGALFVTSERRDGYSPRLFSVRHCSDAGDITTVGEYQEHGSLTAARIAAGVAASRWS